MCVCVFQDAVGVLVDSSEVNSGAIVLSRLRLRYKAHTAVVHLTHAHYAISTRMAVARLSTTGKPVTPQTCEECSDKEGGSVRQQQVTVA